MVSSRPTPTSAGGPSTAEAVVIRPYADADAKAVAELYNRHADAPNPVDRELDARMVRTELAERGTVLFLVAELDGEVLGTLGMFRSSGRRAVSEGEVFGDMFFLSPLIRSGAAAGRMFSQAFRTLRLQGVGAIRLTVNPTNQQALPLYRQLGCTLVGPADAAEDGNIELVSYMPRIVTRLRQDHEDLIPPGLRMTAAWRYQTDGAADRPLGDETETVSGREVLRTVLTVEDLVFQAILDPEDGEILHTAVGEQPDPVLPPKPAKTPGSLSVHRDGPLVIELAHADGSVRVYHDEHVGPVLHESWPVFGPAYVTGWRHTLRRELAVEPLTGALGAGWRVGERHDGGTLYRETRLAGGTLRQRVWWDGDRADAATEPNDVPSNTAPSNTVPSNTAPSNTAPANPAPSRRLRTMVVGGLRSGLLFTGGRGLDERPLYVPSGRGLFPIDATEFGAAGLDLAPGTALAWWDPRTSLAASVHWPQSRGVYCAELAQARLIGDNILALDIRPGSAYRVAFSTARHPGEVLIGATPAEGLGYAPSPAALDTPREEHPTQLPDTPAAAIVTTAGWEPVQVARRPVHRLANGRDTLLIGEQAGGAVSWQNAGRQLLATPFPKTRAFARNASWQAGIWVGRHAPREESRRGTGWGGGDAARSWTFDTATGELVSPGLAWSIEPDQADGADRGVATVVRVSIRADADAAAEPGAATAAMPGEGELVAWVTPAGARAASVLVPGAPGEAWLLDKPGAWQRWTDRLAVRLADGRWLYTESEDPGAAEILVRSTSSGILLALVARRAAAQPGAASWPLAVLEDADTARRLLAAPTDPATSIPAISAAATRPDLVLTGAGR